MKAQKLKINDFVFCMDDNYGKIYGKVIDMSSEVNIIKWQDITDPVEHPKWDTTIRKTNVNPNQLSHLFNF